ncbi:hypothetical protein [Sporosalibacterium faouarense]|uniref:hypothetical protein n=1 Tax=Sporosalibacterium faouarense TaxID=516123 RepID=UPI00192AF05A|nr:hypothetical protein [Sporosalibacterium faouarense]
MCREYTIKNVGKTPVYEIDIISNFQKDTCVFNVDLLDEGILELGVLNYHVLYDRRVGPEESFLLKLCYSKNKIRTGMLSASLEIGMRDDRGNYWMQPFFAPDDKLYKSYGVSYKQYRKRILSDIAIECFKKPYLW